MDNDNFRMLVDGSFVKEYDNNIPVTINSRCPSKWRFVDLETGELWKWDDDANKFTKAKEKLRLLNK